MRQPSLPYNLLKFALQIYGRRPAELDSSEYGVVQSQAQEECVLHARILASDEGLKAAVPQQAVTDALAAVAKRHAAEEDFENDLTTNDLDPDSMAAALEVELIVEAALAQVAARVIPPADQEVEAALATSPQQVGQRRIARQILITLNDDFPENSREQALARIKKVRAVIVDESAEFSAMAARFSECPSSIQGGSLGEIRPGTLYPALDCALFAMAEGEVSEVLESDLGFHLLLCEKILSATVEEQEKIRATIRQQLLAQAQKKALKVWLANLQHADTC